MSSGVADGSIWVEKYRPHSLAEMVGQAGIVRLLQGYAERRSMPHLLFAGPPGTGKTTAALCLARDLFGAEWRQNFLELNASDERGIETVRTKIKEYARTSPLGSVGFKLLFLDEADNLTAEAQASLRRVMERYSGSCRFILSCNYSSRIIDPIQSRCAVFRFRLYPPEDLRTALERVARAEHQRVTPAAFDVILTAAAGDLRRATNLLVLRPYAMRARYSFLRLWVRDQSFHSPCTFPNPLNRNCLSPRPCFIWTNTGSTTYFRWP